MPHGFRLSRLAYTVRLRMRSLLRRPHVEEELSEEFAYYVDRLTEQHIAAGMSEQDARHAARKAFGGAAQRMEECRDLRGVSVFEDFARDTRYGARTLLRAPAFSIAVILTLSLGIGASVAVFTVVNGVLLRPLPYPDADRLFLVSHARLGPFMPQPRLSDSDYLTFRTHDRSFQHLAAYSIYPANVLTPTDPARVAVGRVTAEFFAALAVPAATGRTFLPEDEANADALIVLGHDFWRARMGGDPGIVGRTMTVDGRERTVLGVMPKGFSFPEMAQAWILYTVRLQTGNSWSTPVVGRLKPGVSVPDAQAQFAAVAAHFYDKAGEGWTSGLLSLKDVTVGNVRRPLEVFTAAVGVVLLIACANVANLLLARGSVRQREMALRTALGASRGRLVRQLLTESLLLALLGGALGLALAALGVPALLALAPEGRIPRLETVRIDAAAVGPAIAVSIAAGAAFGLIPAFRLARPRAARGLSPALRTLTRGDERLRSALVVAEIALSLVLLTAGALLTQSFLRMRAVDPGFHAANVLTLTVDLTSSSYGRADQIHRFYADVLERANGVSGAARVSAVNWRPMGTTLISGDFIAEGRDIPRDATVDKPAVSPGYFATMGIALREGRDFTPWDVAGREPVAIVSQSVARLLDPGGHVIGKRISLRSKPTPQDWLTVIGVVDDIRQLGPTQPPHAAIYRPIPQVAQLPFLDQLTFAVRTSEDPLALAPALRSAVHAVDRTLPADAFKTMESVMEAVTAEPRFNARLLGAFAVLALLLTVLGTFGVLAYSVAQRTHEIGVRMALGADGGTVRWMVVRRTLTWSVAGIVLGLGSALAATRLLETLLFEITPTDARTLMAVTTAILIAAIAASYIPARRATRVDPLLALRHE